MRDATIKSILSLSLGMALIASSTSIEAKDSTSFLPPTTKPAGTIVLDHGVGYLYTNSAPALLATVPSSKGRCPTNTTAKTQAVYAANSYPTSTAGEFRYVSLSCNDPDANYKIYCTNALAHFVSPDANAWIYIGWTVYCVPN